MKDFLRTSDLSRADLVYLLSLAARFKERPFRRRAALRNETVCLCFNKPSTRTRISFETAIARLGAHAVSLSNADLQLGRGETVEDTARVISRYARALVIRTYKDEELSRFAAAATIPVINALTDGHHPCQSLADLLTLAEHRGALESCRIAYFGDGNNVAVSLMEAVALAGAHLTLASPPGYEVDPRALESAQELARRHAGDIVATRDPEQAAQGADALYTDVWLSMGHSETARAERYEALFPYQINARLLALAKPDAIFMHCLPAHRGEEVAPEVFEGPRSVVFDQAENRLHTAVAVLYALVKGKIKGAHTP